MTKEERAYMRQKYKVSSAIMRGQDKSKAKYCSDEQHKLRAERVCRYCKKVVDNS